MGECQSVTRKSRRRNGNSTRPYTIALTGNPNAGKTTLFNALTGLRARTGNFSGTTVEYRICRDTVNETPVDYVDLPGMYSLQAVTSEERVARDVLHGEADDVSRPDAVIAIVDADNLERNLFLISQLLELDLRVVVALNMVDIAERHGMQINAERLSQELACPVIPMVAKSGQGVEEMREWVAKLIESHAGDGPPIVDRPKPTCGSCGHCPYQSRYSWSEDVASRCVTSPGIAKSRVTETIDKVLTHPTGGLLAFLGIMLGVFYMIFSVASVPMDMIDLLFGTLAGQVSRLVPAGDLQSLLVDGIIGGVGGVLVFLPQICFLFFFLGILEDSGYLARAAFVLDRLMRRFGLPGTAFVPLVSAHACAIPAIMSARVIHDERDRLLTILVAPLITCSARIPVYAMVAALLFYNQPALAAAMFVGAYLLGIGTALGMAFIFRKTILPGESRPLVLELPGYKVPSLRTVAMYTFDRAKAFVQQAGTIILMISVILWAMATYPKSDTPAAALDLLDQSMAAAAAGNTERAESLEHEAHNIENRSALANSMAGRMGRFVEPVFEPLGFDWQISIGVITSFAAREVIVSTLAIVYGLGEDADGAGLYETLKLAKRGDGTAVFTTATSISLLVFYILAMQCLPTQAVTMRETKSWKWAAFQFGYMTVLAYGAALLAFQGLRLIGIA